MTVFTRSSAATRSSRSFLAPGTPGSVLAVLVATVLAFASSLLTSLTNCVVSRTSVRRLSFCASAAFASANAFFNSAWLQPVVATTASAISQAYLMRTSPAACVGSPARAPARAITPPHQALRLGRWCRSGGPEAQLRVRDQRTRLKHNKRGSATATPREGNPRPGKGSAQGTPAVGTAGIAVAAGHHDGASGPRRYLVHPPVRAHGRPAAGGNDGDRPPRRQRAGVGGFIDDRGSGGRRRRRGDGRDRYRLGRRSGHRRRVRLGGTQHLVGSPLR